jgi:biotin operon repressor
MATPDQLLAVLTHHIGKANGIRVKRLAAMLDIPERQVRNLVTELREQGHAVCGTPKDGYYIAATPSELEQTCKLLRDRSMHSLRLESRLRRISLPDLLGQLHVPT